MGRLKQLVRRKVAGILGEDARSIISNRYIAGKFFPLDPAEPYQLVLKRSPRDNGEAGADLPVPPANMWEGYGRTEKEYLTSGARHMKRMVDILAESGTRAEDLQRVLDFGCAGGRLLRCFPRKGDRQELWGVDISAQYITWCQTHLPPPFLFATTTTFPHLPFEDGYFDLVYCGSVFTHVTELADAWFLELRRVLRKGGHAYITIHDKGTMQEMLSRYRASPAGTAAEAQDYVKVDGEPGSSPGGWHMVHEADQVTGAASKDYASFAMSTDPYSNIFYDTEFLVSKWSRFAEVVSVTPRAYGLQTALLCRKRD